jgi:DNA uptake protein ComE-like DNA-binding protein
MKSFLHFSTGEWVAVIFLLSLIVASFIFYYLSDSKNKSSCDTTSFQKEIAAFEQRQEEIADSIENERTRRNEYYKNSYSENRHNNYFVNYAEKNRFTKDTSKRQLNYEEYKKQYKKQSYEIIKIDLNSCDTSEICTVPQFGSKRAKKIIEYRNRLGGFYSFNQIKEIYIMQNIELSHLEKYFFINQAEIKKIKINTADYKVLSAHPYFDPYLSKSIINYRNRESKISNKEELQKATNAYPELMEKILPYISFE